MESKLEPSTDLNEPLDSITKARGFRARSVILGFLLAIPACYAIVNQPSSAMFSLMVAPISVLLLVIGVNLLLRAIHPKLAFTQADLIVIYVIVTVAGATSGEWTNVSESLVYYLPNEAKTNGTTRDYLLKYIPDSMAIKDLKVVQDIYGGGKSAGYALHQFLTIYLPKVCPWLLLMGSCVIAMLCINSLMRGAWCNRERLSFPLIQLPVAMSEEGGRGPMWKSRYMWIAFVVMFSIDILNGLNYLYPNLPAIPVKTLFQLDGAIKDPPFNQIGDFRISIYPFMAAVGLFMPSDMLLSFVVFFLLRKLTHVALAANGIAQSTFSGSGLLPGPPYFDEQTWGAVIALFLGAIWVSREYLKSVWREIRTYAPSEDGGLRHTWSFIGLMGSLGIVVGFGMFLGSLSLPYAVAYVGAFMMFSIVLTRVRAQLGPPTNEFAFLSVNSLLGRFLGNKWLTDQQAVWVNTGYLSFNRIFRNHPMPVQLEAMKMGQTERLNSKKIFGVLAVASLMGIFLCYAFNFVLAYRTGTIPGSDAAGYFDKIAQDRHGPDIVGIVMTIFGFAVVMVLDTLRFRFPGFPLHPAGYFLSMNYGVDYYWFGLLIALLVKNFVQKYYGLVGYEKLRSVALGILLGEYAAETIWMGMALITKQSTYTIGFNDRSLGTQ